MENLQIKDSRIGVPTSKNPQKIVDPPSDKVTHVYVKQHNTRGLEEMYRGPMKVLDRPNRSSLEIKAGLTSQGEVRKELRAWSDCKPANLREGAVEAERPRRGRPPKERTTSPTPDLPSSSTPEQPSSPTHRPVRQTRNPSPNYVDTLSIDFSKPPPPIAPPAAEPAKTWTASKEELSVINRSIRGS